MKKRIVFVLAVLFMVVFSGYAQFVNITASSGIKHSCRSGSLIGGGVAFLDINKDGWEDLIMTGGTEPDRLYINQRDRTFKDESFRFQHNARKTSLTSAVAIGDIDNDGCEDVLFTTLNSSRPNILMKNNCDGTFVEITSYANLVETAQSTGAVFYDFNKDGFQDIYVFNYVRDYEFVKNSAGDVIGYNHGCYANFFYINNGDLTFTESALQTNLDTEACTLAGIVHESPRLEPTLCLVNDFGEWIWPNEQLLFGEDYISDVAPSINMDQGIYGMGIAMTHMNDDVLADYYVSNIGSNAFLLSQEGVYQNVSQEYGISVDTTESGQNRTSWGTIFFDFDNDGDDDLYVANGDVGTADFLNVTKEDHNFLFDNQDGSFVEVDDRNFHINGKSRGVAYGDIDNDGDLDIAVARVGIFEDQPGPYDTYQLLENISENDHGFLTIYPRNSFGSIPYGLEVSVYSEGDSLTRILYSGGSYASQSELKLHFGLGLKNFVDSIKMLWPDGERLIFEDVPINENLFVHQQEKLLLIMGCMDESSPSFNPSAEYALSCSAELSTNLEKITKNELFTYPNPVIDELYINNSGQSMITDIHIYNTKGQKMYTTQINRSDEHITLNCSWLNSGNYYFSIGNQSGEIIAFQAMKE